MKNYKIPTYEIPKNQPPITSKSDTKKHTIHRKRKKKVKLSSSRIKIQNEKLQTIERRDRKEGSHQILPGNLGENNFV